MLTRPWNILLYGSQACTLVGTPVLIGLGAKSLAVSIKANSDNGDCTAHTGAVVSRMLADAGSDASELC